MNKSTNNFSAHKILGQSKTNIPKQINNYMVNSSGLRKRNLSDASLK
jgi:hypothetical protein